MLAKLIEFPVPSAKQKPKTKATDTLSTILGLLNRVSAIVDDKRDPNAGIEKIFKEVCDFSGWPIGHLYVQNPKEPAQFISHNIWYLDKSLNQTAIQEFQQLSEETVFTLGKGLVGQIAQSMQAQAIEDVSVLKQFLRADAAKRNGVSGFFGFPIILDNQCVAVAEFYGREVGLLDATSLEIMTYVSSQLARLFERARLEKSKDVMMSNFETNVQGAVKDLGATALDLSQAATSLNDQCESSLQNCTQVVQGSQEIESSTDALEVAMNSLRDVEVQTEEQTGRVVNTVDQLAEDIRSATEQLTFLNRAAEDIGSIIRDVGEIAGQVRMLGLNASIEAARAGVAGKGFAIVASEIKSLAAQSEHASNDISNQILKIQETIQSSAETMERVSLRMSDLEDTTEIMSSVVVRQQEASNVISSHVLSSKKTIGAIAQDVNSMNTSMMSLAELSTNLRNLASGLETTTSSVSSSSLDFLELMKTN